MSKEKHDGTFQLMSKETLLIIDELEETRDQLILAENVSFS